MISLSFNIQNPFSHKFELYWSKCFQIISKHKFIHLQLYRNSSLLTFNFDLSIGQVHPGIKTEIGLLGFCAEFEFYDCRHWGHSLSRREFYESHDNCKG